MKKIIFIPFTFFSLIMLSSCQTSWNEKERTELSSISINKVTSSKNALGRPGFVNHEIGNQLAGQIGSQTGLVGGLVGGLIIGAVQTAAELTFQKKNKVYIEKILQNTPKDIEHKLFTSINNNLKKQSFFSSRIKNNAPIKLSTKILSHGVSKVGRGKFQTTIKANVNIKSNEGKTYFNKNLLSFGSPQSNKFQGRKLTIYSQNPNILKENYDRAIQGITSVLMNELNKKTATKK